MMNGLPFGGFFYVLSLGMYRLHLAANYHARWQEELELQHKEYYI